MRRKERQLSAILAERVASALTKARSRAERRKRRSKVIAQFNARSALKRWDEMSLVDRQRLMEKYG